MKLKFYAVAGAMVPDYAAQEGGVKRFVGWQHDPSLGEAGGWRMKDEPTEVEYQGEYVRDCLAGALMPADEATAKACGAKWATAEKAPNAKKSGKE